MIKKLSVGALVVSEEDIVVRYDGPSLAGHKMDVEELAPALMALAALCRSTNEKYNGDRASVNLLIEVDIEQSSFQFKFQIVQKILERAQSLIQDQGVITAKEIFEWLGLLKGPALGLFGLLKVLRGRPPDSIQMSVQNGKNVTQVVVQGNVYVAHPQAAEMLKDATALSNAAKVTAPNLREGYERLEFRKGDKSEETISKDEARAISDMTATAIAPSFRLPPSTIRAWVKIRRAVYEGTGKWTIQHDRSRDVSMLDQDWLADFQARRVNAPPGSLLDVEMGVSEIELDANNNPIRDPDYSIIKVHGIEIPPSTPDLFESGG